MSLYYDEYLVMKRLPVLLPWVLSSGLSQVLLLLACYLSAVYWAVNQPAPDRFSPLSSTLSRAHQKAGRLLSESGETLLPQLY